MAIKFARKTPEEVLEEASFREVDEPIVYQGRDGKVFTSWQDYVWSQVKANANASTVKASH